MMKVFGVAFTIITYSVISVNANEVEDLSGKKWVLYSDTLNITVPAIIPGNVHMDLLRNGIISDPYYEEGDKKFAWVAEYNWTYVTRISCKLVLRFVSFVIFCLFLSFFVYIVLVFVFVQKSVIILPFHSYRNNTDICLQKRFIKDIYL